MMNGKRSQRVFFLASIVCLILFPIFLEPRSQELSDLAKVQIIPDSSNLILQNAIQFLEFSLSDEINDTSGPVISDINHYPELPSMSDTIIVNSTITDESGVISATVFYRLSDEPWLSKSMDNLVGNTYQASIEPLSASCELSYFISATDASENHNIAINDNGGLYYRFTVSRIDDAGPLIEILPIIPQNPTELDSVKVMVNITSEINLDRAILTYSIDSFSTGTNISMSFLDGLYSGTIPSFDAGIIVSYKIIAYDVSGNCVVSSDQTYSISPRNESLGLVDGLLVVVIISSLMVSIIGLYVIVGELHKRREI